MNQSSVLGVDRQLAGECCSSGVDQRHSAFANWGRVLRTCWSLCTPLVVLLWNATARAADERPLRVALHYETRSELSGCPSRSEFQLSISSQLGYDPFDDHAEQHVFAWAAATPAGLQARVVWRYANGAKLGERQFLVGHSDCRQLARSLAFAIVVQLQLLEASPGASAEPVADDPDRAETRAGDESSVLQEPSEIGAGSPWLLSVGGGPSIALGIAPEPSALARGFVSTGRDGVSAELGAAGSWPRVFRASDGRGFQSRVLFATLAPCVHLSRFGACGLLNLGELSVRGSGIDEPRAARGVLTQAGVRLAFSQRFGAITSTLRVETLHTFGQWTVQVNARDLWTMPSLTIQAGVDFAFSLELGG